MWGLIGRDGRRVDGFADEGNEKPVSVPSVSVETMGSKLYETFSSAILSIRGVSSWTEYSTMPSGFHTIFTDEGPSAEINSFSSPALRIAWDAVEEWWRMPHLVKVRPSRGRDNYNGWVLEGMNRRYLIRPPVCSDSRHIGRLYNTIFLSWSQP